MLLRGGVLSRRILFPEGEACWNAEDWARAATLEARWKAHGVSEAERERLLPCAILHTKWPGTHYSEEVESRLKELAAK